MVGLVEVVVEEDDGGGNEAMRTEPPGINREEPPLSLSLSLPLEKNFLHCKDGMESVLNVLLLFEHTYLTLCVFYLEL